MIPASDEFKAALRSSHVALTRAVVLEPQSDNTYSEGETLAVASGNLNIDGTRNIWRQGSFVLAPASPFLLDPLDQIDGSTRLRIDRGIRMFNGLEEWVTIATLQVQQASRSLDEGTLRVDAYDLGSSVQDYDVKVWNPTADSVVSLLGKTAGTELTNVEAIQYLVAEAQWDTPIWTIDDDVDTEAIPPVGTTFTGNRWTAINNLAKAIGCIVNAEYDGTWRIRQNDTAPAVMSVVEGTPDGVLVERTLKQSRREMFNGVTVTWETPTTSGTVFVVDSDPNSTTYWDGPWGRRTAPAQRLDTVTTEEQAIDAAYALLEQYRGRQSQIDFRSVHNPLLEPFDIVSVNQYEPSGRTAGVTEDHVMDAIQYPLMGGEMSGETRQLS